MKSLVISNNGRIMIGPRFRNFSGRRTQWDPIDDGRTVFNRTFCVELHENDPDYSYGNDILRIQDLIDDGWNVYRLDSKDEGGEPLYMLRVKVTFGQYPPAIKMTTPSGEVDLNEETVSELDRSEILNARMVIRPYEYKKGKIAAYLKTLYLVVSDKKFGGAILEDFDEYEFE